MRTAKKWLTFPFYRTNPFSFHRVTIIRSKCGSLISLMVAAGLQNFNSLFRHNDDYSQLFWFLINICWRSIRLLRSRSGHSLPPSLIRYYKTGQQILSTGQDHSLRVFHTFRDRQNSELSQGHIERKAKKLNQKEIDLKFPITKAMDHSVVRERDWDNIVTCHEGSKTVRLWSFDRLAVSKKKIKLVAAATAVAMSACGNFCFLGDAAGRLHKFNVQSGLARGSSTSSHSNQITAVALDLLNSIVISTSLDGYIKVCVFLEKIKKTADQNQHKTTVLGL